eukprot:m.1043033 g.1043033  ORF g.1043033 m.1043033 type:complete len:1308 (-) comp24163_c0_seq5:265-4188(-)
MEDFGKGDEDSFLHRIGSWYRVRALQNDLEKGDLFNHSTSSVEGHNACLLVLGIDGQFHQPTARAANYYLFGLSSHELDSPNVGCNKGDAFDDVMLIIKPYAVHIFCNPEVYTKILHATNLWEDVHIHCNATNDPEQQENLKLQDFVAITKTCSTIGVFLEGQEAFSVVEQWPIVQAYAFEGAGGGGSGFFTLAHTVVDVSPLLQRACAQVDIVEMHHTLSVQRARVEARWADVSGTVTAVLHQGFVELNSNDDNWRVAEGLRNSVQQSLEAYRRHDERHVANDGMQQSLSEQPTSLVQVHVLHPGAPSATVCVDVRIADAAGPLVCRRTLFVHEVGVKGPQAITTGAAQAAGNSDASIGVVSDIYALLVDLASEAMRLFSLPTGVTYCNGERVCDAIRTLFRTRLEQLPGCALDALPSIALEPSITRRSVESTVGCDTLPDPLPVFQLYYVELCVQGISQQREDSSTACQLAYGDVFVVATPASAFAWAPLAATPAVGVPTRIVPACQAWNCGALAQQDNHDVGAEAEAVLVCGERCSNVVAVALHPWGLALRCARLGVVQLVIDAARAPTAPATFHIAEMTLQMPSSADREEGVAALQVSINPEPPASVTQPGQQTAQRTAWGLLLGVGSAVPADCVVLVPSAIGAAVVTRWVASWQAHVRVSVGTMADDAGSHRRAQARPGPASAAPFGATGMVVEHTYAALVAAAVDTSQASEVSAVTTFARSAAVRVRCPTSVVPMGAAPCDGGGVPLLRSAVDDSSHTAHAVCTALQTAVAHRRTPGGEETLESTPGGEATVGSTSDGEETLESTPGGDVAVTVLTGVPGAGKARVSASLVALTSDTVQWLVLRTEVAAGIDFNPAKLHEQLASAVASVDTVRARGRPGSETVARRVLVVTAGFVPVATVLHAIMEHPDADVRGRVRIAAVVGCVDPVGCVLAGRRLLPRVLEQCALGWCDTIVVTGSSTAPGDTTAPFALSDAVLRVVNPLAAIVHAHDGRIVTDAAFDAVLADGVFHDQHKRHIRALRRLGKRPTAPPIEPVVVCHVLHITVPLHRRQMACVVAALRDNATTCCVLRIKGRVQLDLSPDAASTDVGDEEAVWHTVSYARAHPQLYTSRLEREPPHGTVQIVAVGSDLSEADARSILRRCRKQPARCKARRTVASLTEAERREVADKICGSDLPEGYFHNGRQYVCMDGTKSLDHPLLSAFLEAHVRDLNAKIDAFNDLLPAGSLPAPGKNGDGGATVVVPTDANVHDGMFLVPRVSPTRPTAARPPPPRAAPPSARRVRPVRRMPRAVAFGSATPASPP